MEKLNLGKETVSPMTVGEINSQTGLFCLKWRVRLSSDVIKNILKGQSVPLVTFDTLAFDKEIKWSLLLTQ